MPLVDTGQGVNLGTAIQGQHAARLVCLNGTLHGDRLGWCYLQWQLFRCACWPYSDHYLPAAGWLEHRSGPRKTEGAFFIWFVYQYESQVKFWDFDWLRVEEPGDPSLDQTGLASAMQWAAWLIAVTRLPCCSAFNVPSNMEHLPHLLWGQL